jgi:tRNA modification GTPase
LIRLRGVVAGFRITAEQVGSEPRVCLVGAANAGKSSLFNRLSGAAALVSPVAGTTRDWLEAEWCPGGRRVRLVDTAGWISGTGNPDLRTGGLHGASLILACSAADAPLPDDHGLPSERTLVIATKADLGVHDARAVLAVSAGTGAGLEHLARLVADRLGGVAAGEPRQQRLLAACDGLLGTLCEGLPADELLADDLRRATDLLGELIGTTTPDDVLEAIFSRFCIGK